MTSAISARDLRKAYGRTAALGGLDLEVAQGEVHGLLGPNGAGKTTTLRILLGLHRADGGSVEVLGLDPWRDSAQLHRRTAYVPGDVELWPDLTGGEAIGLLSGLRGGSSRKRRDQLLDRFQLDPTKKGRTYSKGNRQKVALVAAFSSDAELLVLDEPTTGLDPLMEVVFQECVREVRSEGRTVLLSSHILAQVEALADSVSIVRQGSVVESGSLTALRHLTRTVIEAATEEPAHAFGSLEGVSVIRLEDHRVVLEVEPEQLSSVLGALSRLRVRSLESRPPTLEQILLSHYSNGPASGDAE